MAAAAAARKPATKRPAKKAAPQAKAAAPQRRASSARAARNAHALERARTGHATKTTARTAPAAPRRKSGPVRRPVPAKRTVVAPRTAAPALARVAQGGASLLLDNILRGRAWVFVVGVLLAGIVFLNVSVLELNRGIAHTAAKSETLERTNSRLRDRVAKLDSAERIQRAAEARGFVLPQPGDVTYVDPRLGRDARLAVKRLAQPAPEPVVPTTAPVEPVVAPVEPVAAPAPEPVAIEPVATTTPAPVAQESAVAPTTTAVPTTP
jgi:cell division protein FtsB